ncbi:ATP-dependent protease subunit HslV [uncultured Desulfovibrio sp.]|uniref:ATP-dependent protease subunit HslV n=1 Tax=uncultured Desulfovibrio sp. TaxID=167968 RepID=UPI00260B4727|nr:ATP-dependent protease subunit HslV [uncultured Desulfovibrio sp.]
MEMHSTTILAVKKNGLVAMAGDGQVTLGQSMVMKHSARKIRRLNEGKVLAGFAGATADAFTLFELFEAKLKEFRGNLLRAAVEMTKEWRKDKYLHKLEAMLLLADSQHLLLLSGTGDVIEPDDDVAAIGSGGPFALSAARALVRHSDMTAPDIVREAMQIASEICVYTNDHFTVETL